MTAYNVVSGISEQDLVENGDSRWKFVAISFLSSYIMCFRFKVRHFVFRLSADVGQCRLGYSRIGHGRTHGGSRRNVADNISRKVVMLVYSKTADFRRIFPV